MIKAAGGTGDGPFLLLGLSRTNTERLLTGKPITLDTGDMGLPRMRVIIMGGETEQAIAAELASHGMVLPPGWDEDLG